MPDDPVQADGVAAQPRVADQHGGAVQYAALLVLNDHLGVSAAELARRCRVTPQTMTTIVRKLGAADLIARVPHEVHRNVLETRLTDAGRAAFEVADERASAVERRLADEFSPQERETLRALPARCSKALTERP